MKTKKSTLRQVSSHLACLVMLPLLSFAQSDAQNLAEPRSSEVRPLQSDNASSQLIKNYLTVIGVEKAQMPLLNVVAKGTIKESTLIRNFKLIESADGKRHLTYYWTHLGRKHRVIYVHDGLETWKQVLEPNKQEAEAHSGVDGTHFANQRWLLQPFTLPRVANYVFKYQGTAQVSKRPAYLIKGYGKNNTQSWFYFDKEKSLLTRWGSEGQIAGSTVSMDYRATQFKSVDGVLLPSQIDLLAKNAVFGRIQLEQISVNQDLNNISFFMPQSTIPTLRQRPTVKK